MITSVKAETQSHSRAGRVVLLLAALLGFALMGLGIYGYVANGSAMFLAMADSLAAWCM